MGAWGAGSFENDSASDFFYFVEEAVDPGEVIALALDRAIGQAEHLDLDASCEAIAAAELLASCAGQPPDALPDQIRAWTAANAHEPHQPEVEQALQAVSRVRAESELRELWEETEGKPENAWLPEVDGLLYRLRRC